jgi:hypothetical protein
MIRGIIPSCFHKYRTFMPQGARLALHRSLQFKLRLHYIYWDARRIFYLQKLMMPLREKFIILGPINRCISLILSAKIRREFRIAGPFTELDIFRCLKIVSRLIYPGCVAPAAQPSKKVNL